MAIDYATSAGLMTDPNFNGRMRSLVCIMQPISSAKTHRFRRIIHACAGRKMLRKMPNAPLVRSCRC